MNEVLLTMNPTTSARLRMALSVRTGGSAMVRTGNRHRAFHAIALACRGVGEQRKGGRVSASGEAV
jgi:hypothetical protein